MSETMTSAAKVNSRKGWRRVGWGLGIFGIFILALVVLAWPRREPVYEGKPLSYWVERSNQIEEFNGVPEDAQVAIRAIGPKAVPFLLEWMPHYERQRPEFLKALSQWVGRWFSKPSTNAPPSEYGLDFAWWALGEKGKSAIPVLARNLNKSPFNMRVDYDVWTESAKAISYLGPDAIAPMLTAATNMSAQGRRETWELIHNFENLGTNGEPAVPALISWANDGEFFVRAAVMSALGGIGRRPDLAVPVLLKGLKDTNSMVCRDAAEALGAFANDSELVLPALIEALKSPDWDARGGALSGLGKIRSKPEVVIPLIVPHLQSPEGRAAAYALRELGSEAGFEALGQETNNVDVGVVVSEVRQKMGQSSKSTRVASEGHAR